MLVVRHLQSTTSDLAGRKAFHNEAVAVLKRAMRGSGWRKRETRLYRQVGDWAAGAKFMVASNRQESGVEIEVKPMALDDLMWEISSACGYPGENLPFGARFWSSARCAVPVARTRWWPDDGLTAEDTVERLFAELARAPDLIEVMKSGSFAAYLEGYREANDRFDFGSARVVAHICEGRPDTARGIAKDILENPRSRSTTLRFKGQDGEVRQFEELALIWLDQQGRKRQ